MPSRRPENGSATRAIAEADEAMKKEITPTQTVLVVIGVLLLLGVLWFWKARYNAALEEATSAQVDASGHRHLPGVAGRPMPPGASGP